MKSEFSAKFFDRSQAVKDSWASGAARRLHLEQFPGYAPELNPDEGIWHDLKRVELKHVFSKYITATSVAR
ncbi:MAG: transposase [Candidatus Tectomicrobia bacterium]|nr:transposase [Candidatus Tectomicrobia bacterium]